ncbi:MAG: HNH endonuclease domain-containing protein [Polyangiales bacterium]
MSGSGDETLRFAEQVIVLLDQGRQTATYKFAVLLGLMDLCLELTDRFGDPPSHIMTGQLAEKVIALYWPHAQPMDVTSGIVLQQNTGKRARVLQLIDDFRSSASAGRSVTLHAAKLADRSRWETLRAEVEWTLVKMPLPKLQRASGTEDRFIYHIGWDDDVSKSAWRSGAIDSRIHLEPGVARSFVRLAGLLRPLIQERWVAMVGRLNDLEVTRVHGFLFGVDRVSLGAVREPLRELQNKRCFYCDGALQTSVEVDHFLPWARHADNGIENLVAAHGRCNGSKKDFLAAAVHVERWARRVVDAESDLARIAKDARWPSDRNRTLGAVRGIYLPLPDGVSLWRGHQDFEASDRSALRAALRVA